jgi:hypothetical protein
MDRAHQRPDDVDDLQVEAAGKMSEAFEWIERARGQLYTMHQLIGRADALAGDAADLLDAAGRPELADDVRTRLVGRNVLDGRWTFQVVEEFDDGYYADARAVELRVREELLAGRRHVYEAELKERRRTRGRPGHEAGPGSPRRDRERSGRPPR